MNCCCTMILGLIFLSVANISCADTLVITYTNGKMQTVLLDENSSSIQSLHYLSETMPSATHKPVVPEQQNKITTPKQSEDNSTESRDKPSKGGLKFKWAEPLISK